MTSPAPVSATLLLCLCVLASPGLAQTPPAPGALDAKKKQLARDAAEAAMDEVGDPMKKSTSAAERGAKLTLQFFDATTGNPIPDAAVTLEGERVTTTARGMASFAFPAVPDSADVVLSATFSKEGARAARGATLPESQRGYVPSKVQLHFMAGTIWNNRFSISPLLEAGKLRIVLDWSDSPPDLDAHLVRQGAYHVSFRDKKSYLDQAFLDRDAMTGFGPETVTIEKVDEGGRYLYAVHDYTNSANSAGPALGASKARVMVFNDRELAQTFIVPAGKGNVWTVFEVAGGVVRPINKLGGGLPGQ